MKNRDFIITSLQPWDIEIGSTIKNTGFGNFQNEPCLIYKYTDGLFHVFSRE